MGFSKKTIRDIDIRGKKLLIRVDYSVELDISGQIVDDYKIRASLPTLRYALEQGASIVLISHMGRPEGVFSSSLSLFAVAKRLRELLEHDVDFVPECVGERASKAKKSLQPGQVVLFENLRFDVREENNNEDFAAELARGMDIFVQDGFAVCYREHASVSAITKKILSVAGLLLAKEMTMLGSVFDENSHSTVAIINGLSITERLPVIEKALLHADVVVFGGLVADVFLHASGLKTGKTAIHSDEIPLAKQLMSRFVAATYERGVQLVLPFDAVVTKRTDVQAKTRIVDWSAHVISEIESYPRRPLHEESQVQHDETIVDVGPFTGAYVAGLIQHAQTVLLVGTPGDTTVYGAQGPVGPFAHGTELILEAMTGQFGKRPKCSIVVGDDAVGFTVKRGVERAFNHVSTGGGASLEVLAGQELIGVALLEET